MFASGELITRRTSVRLLLFTKLIEVVRHSFYPFFVFCYNCKEIPHTVLKTFIPFLTRRVILIVVVGTIIIASTVRTCDGVSLRSLS